MGLSNKMKQRREVKSTIPIWNFQSSAWFNIPLLVGKHELSDIDLIDLKKDSLIPKEQTEHTSLLILD